MDVPIENYLKMNRVMLSIIGLWPYQKRKNLLVRRIFFVLYILVGFISQIAVYFTSPTLNIPMMADMAAVNLCTMEILIILITFYSNDKQNKALWDIIYNDWNSVTNEVEKEVKIFYANLGRMLSIVMTWVLITGLTMFVLVTSFFSQILDIIKPLNEPRPYLLPFRVDYIFFDVEDHPIIAIILIQCTVVCFVIIGAVLTCNFWTQTLHILGMLKLTGFGMGDLFIDNGVMNSLEIDAIFYASTVVCIQRHQKVLKVRNLIQQYYNIASNLLLIEVVVALSVSLLQISKPELGGGKTLFQNLIVFGFTFLHAIFAQQMTNYSADIYDKVYMSDWYRASPRLRKLLPMILRQAQRPYTLISLKIVVISYVNLREVLRLSISYYTVINNM